MSTGKIAADGRSTRWDGHRTARRKALVEATLRAIRRHGATVGMDEIAGAAGTSKTVLYRHFTDRAGLYHAVADRVDALILRDVTKALGASGAELTDVEESPRVLIGAAIDSYLQLVERDPEVYRFIVNAPLLAAGSGAEGGPVGDVLGDPAGEVGKDVAEQISAVIRQALGATGQDPAAATVWGHGLVGMVRAAADAWLAQAGSPGAMSRRDLAQHLSRLAWCGLGSAWPRPSEKKSEKKPEKESR